MPGHAIDVVHRPSSPRMNDVLARFWEILRFLLPAVPATLQITFASFVLALVLGVVVGMLRIQKQPLLRGIGRLYVDCIRGVPLLVIVFFVYFGLGKVLHLPQFVAGVLAIGFCYSAYIGESVRAGIEAIPNGQWEAARSLGMSWPMTMRHVVLPQAFRIVIPPLMNEFISCLKDSSLVSVVGLRELTRAGRDYASARFVDFQTWFVVGLLYLAMTLALTRVSGALERRMKVPERETHA